MLTLPAIPIASQCAREKNPFPSPTLIGKKGNKDPVEKVRSQLLERQMLQQWVVQKDPLLRDGISFLS